MNIKLKNYLSLIAWSEGASTAKDTKNHGYDVIVHGISNTPTTFTDYSRHPNVLVTLNNRGLKSTAAGRYQVLYKYWVAYKKQLNLKGFYPDDQDAIAIQLIRECKAYDDVINGNIESAIVKCSSRWASLPGAGYGQREHNIATLLNQYQSIANIA